MSSRVICPSCNEEVEVRSEFVGSVMYCPRCGQAMRIPAHFAPASQGLGYDHFDTGSVRYAGFWIRVVADLIDTAVLIIPCLIANLVIPILGGTVCWFVYKGLCLGNWNGQTVGKRACGIRVVDQSLQPCTVNQGFGRTAAEILSSIILCIGYIMAGFDQRKQALHDKCAGTLHVYAD